MLGIGVLTSLIYIFLKNTESLAQFFRTTRIISVVGLWLTSIGFIGKARLERWETNVKNLLQNTKNDKTAESVHQRQWGILPGVISLVTGLLVALSLAFARPLLSLVLSSLSVPPEMEDYVILSILIASVVIFILSLFLYPFIGYALIIPLQVLLLPFHLADALDKTSIAERGLVIIGLLLSTIGLLLNF